MKLALAFIFLSCFGSADFFALRSVVLHDARRAGASRLVLDEFQRGATSLNAPEGFAALAQALRDEGKCGLAFPYRTEVSQ